jgi:hypothetical protein
VASVDGSLPPQPGASSQVEAAKALEGCLKEVGLPAVTLTETESEARVIWSPASASEIIWSTPFIDAGVQPRRGETGPPETEVEAFMEEYRGSFGLRIDGVDRSVDYERCYRSSGYEPPSLWGKPYQEIAYKRSRVEVSNRWAECAREHGFPSVADVDPPVADQGTTWPVVILPKFVTQEQIAVLLESCPIVADGVVLSDEDIGRELAKVPAIGFDSPFFDGRSFREPPTSEDYARYGPLLKAVYGQLDEFFGDDGWSYGFGISASDVDRSS